MDEFAEQAARALNMEHRFMRQQAAITANIIASAYGSKG
jgi:hypothetical protein